MSDDLDDMIRHAMKTLDDEVPSGYFEGLPQRALARLEDGTRMESSGTHDTAPTPLVAPQNIIMSDTNENDREEDSGLHDIRNLAAASKSRISARRSTQSPVVTEDDVLASSSAGWKGIALPEPAKMISLPELASLPSAVDIERADKASRAEAKTAAKQAKAESKRDSVAVIATASDSAVSAPMIGSRIAAKQSGGKGTLYAGIGVLLAAAAGVGIYMFTTKGSAAPASATQVASAPVAPAPELKHVTAPIVQPIEEPNAAEPVAPVEPVAVVEDKKAAAPAKAEKVHKVEIRDNIHTDAVEKPVAKVEKKDEPKEKGDGTEPSFDALLKEGGISDSKQAAKPTLDKKSLTTGDFKTGMAAVSGRAQGCYAGTQGTANVKLTIASDGSVSKASVSGPFAGTPVASCVEGAVKAAKFPAWDGGPQSFSYAYLLAE
ncbi:hypothetical protein BH11MYX2_BH11MYX2_31690 [soil metagenome]